MPAPSPDLDVRLPTPGSIVWESVGETRSLIALVPALVLQAAHPTISAGLVDHSMIRTDPWRRLRRSLFPIVSLAYDEDPVAVGTAIRDRHTAIKGRRPDGSRYHALHPDAYWFVLATGFEALVATHARYGRPLTDAEVADAYAEYRSLWRLVGLGDDDIPDTVEGFWTRYRRMVREDLQRTPSLGHVLALLRTAPPPPALEGRAGRAAWRVVRRPISRLVLQQTAWQLGPEVRAQLGFAWDPRAERRARLVAGVLRSGLRLVPRPLRLLPPAVAGNRREGTLFRLRPGGSRRTAA